MCISEGSLGAMSHVLITGSYTSDTSLSVKPAGVMMAVGGTDLTHAHNHTCVKSS